jgi:hypothetical protein
MNKYEKRLVKKPYKRKTTPSFMECSVCHKKRHHCVKIKGSIYCRNCLPEKIPGRSTIYYVS